MRHRAEWHPDWCGRGHLCSHDRPGGQHRSHPVAIDAPAGRLVVTRTRSASGRDSVEIRLVADLPSDGLSARRVTTLLVALVGQAVATARLGGAAR